MSHRAHRFCKVRHLAAVGLSLTLGGCAAGSSSSGARDATVPGGSLPPGPESRAVEVHGLALYSDPGINLHHFLYQWALSEAELSPKDYRTPWEIPEKADLPKLTPEERDTWAAAVAKYRDHAVQESLLFDRALLIFRADLLPGDQGKTPFLDRLRQRVDNEDLKRLRTLREAFEAAEEIYRRHWWVAHRQSNETWIAAVIPHLETYGAALAAGLAEAYGGMAPEGPSRVDVSVYTHVLGAYTTDGPHLTITSREESYQKYWALEMVYHELSHDERMIGAVSDALRQTFGALDQRPPRDLWHVILFHSAGELTRQTLARDGIDYVPYGERWGLWTRNRRWGALRQQVVAHWQPYLEGQTDRATAIEALTAALAKSD